MFENVGGNMERYMDLLTARQKIVASNIANADTPGYKAKDIDFQSEFQSALDTHSPQIIEVPGLKVRNDGNNVSIDRESRLLSENAIRFSLASQIVKNEFKDIATAIQGGTSA
ncbi:MAG: flagellar basal-body rod protein FlgB [Bryobacterales bacterium]|nr:flagellar basal-body rod protein FlgB [Bryobacterales bacterium]